VGGGEVGELTGLIGAGTELAVSGFSRRGVVSPGEGEAVVSGCASIRLASWGTQLARENSSKAARVVLDRSIMAGCLHNIQTLKIASRFPFMARSEFFLRVE
jgi:hypothetical protein